MLVTTPTWVSGGSTGTSLLAVGHDTFRTAYLDRPGEWGVYHRYQSNETFQPPFRWTGRIRCRSIMDPAIFVTGVPAWYTPMVNFHPLYPNDSHNVVVQFGRASDPPRTGTTAEMRDERPDRPYGVRTGYLRRNVTRLPSNPYSGGWHDFAVQVDGPGRYSLIWGGATVVDVVEKDPPTILPGRVPVGLRLDFADVELADMRVHEEKGTNVTTIPGVETFHPRSEWEPGPGAPWTGDLLRDSSFHRQPPALTIGNVDRDAIHYTAAIDLNDGDPGEIIGGVDGIRTRLRNSTYDYLANRTGGGYRRLSDGRWFPGYPLGYSFAYDWLGGVWEINGFDYKPAATSGHNSHTIAHLMLTDRADPGSELMWQSVRAVRREAQRRGSNSANRPLDHNGFLEEYGYGTATGCCGDALRAQIACGLGDLDYNEGDIMRPLTVPERAYDSRGGPGVDPILGTANSELPAGPMAANETRKVIVGLCSEAFVNVTAIGARGGYITISGTSERSTTSLVNTDPDGIANAGAPVATPEGAVYITSSHGGVDVVVDVFARG